jgi:hypothetical protein
MTQKSWDTPPSAAIPSDPNLPTDIVFVMDKSGSMGPLADDTINGFNSFIVEQTLQPGAAFLTLVLFDTEVTILAERKPIADVPLLTRKEYKTGGNTALIDAVGAALAKLEQSTIPGRVLFVVATDGRENSSREYTAPIVRAKIEERTKAGWGFVFLGANASEWQGASMGFAGAGAYTASPAGTKSMYGNLTRNTTSMRASGATGQSAATTMDWATHEDEPKT